MRSDGSRSCIFVASFNAIMTSPTLTACSQVARAVGQLCPRLPIIEAEALPEFIPVVAAPQHLHDVGREKEEERQREKQIVDEPNHSAGTL